MKRSLRMGLVLSALTLSTACSKSNDVNDEETDGVNADAGTGGADAASSGSTDAGGSASGDAGRVMDGGARADGGGGGQRPAQECPATVPVNGSACVSGRGDCTIGTTFCDCPSDTQTWICWKPSDCPAQAPAEGAACTLPGMQCDIPGATPADDGLECECTAQGWDCGRQACPASEPAAGGACEGGDGVCAFGARTCDCRSRQWLCWNNSDCPATPPAADSACPLQRMLCDYPSGECECSSRGWECEGADEDDEDGGVDAGRDASTPDAAQPGDAAADSGVDAAG
ncbi:MAG TPA: hypothetical protein VFZ61_23865 [Polyangiales bacterium]